MSFGRLLNQAVDVQRTTRVADGSGGWTTAGTLILRAIPCRFNALGTRDMIMAYDKPIVFADSLCFMGYQASIREGDMLIKCDDSRQFEVKLLMDWDEARNYLKLAVRELARATA